MSNQADVIRELRERTGAGIVECKKAILDAEGDITKAIALIQERGLAKFEKRAGRETGAGHIEAYVHGGRIGVVLELRAETDFVVRSEPFRTLAHELAMQIAAAAPLTVEELLAQPYIKDESQPIENLVKQVVAKVGENIRVNKFYRLEA